MWNKLAPWQLFLKLYQIDIVFYLDITKGHFIESTYYLLQPVLVTVFTWRKEAQKKKKTVFIKQKIPFCWWE